jgi:hypothetical protein
MLDILPLATNARSSVLLTELLAFDQDPAFWFVRQMSGY